MIRDIFQPFYIFQPALNHKIQTQQQKALTYRYSLMVPLLNDDEEHPNQQDCNALSLRESQWKLRQEHNQNFQRSKVPMYNKNLGQKKAIKPKKLNYVNHSQGSK